ncbi:thiol-disulfide oxidoreductase DCC family protein [Streptomyces sp. NPDC096136]|uniref:thiol-disulfide oxidoreductase DCC family protein n=1 Tax=Streptomyces sp. NPDC096136 TaxID=3366076 RepID=UPI003812740F
MAAQAGVRYLTVLYDRDCPVCVHIRNWLGRQRQLVPLRLVPAASAQAWRRFPKLAHAQTLREITVIGDGGQVWRGTDAFIMCLWALADHRAMADRLATPAGRPFAKAAMYTAAAVRHAVRTKSAADPGEPACDEQCSASR